MVKCHEIVCQLRPLLYSLGLTNELCISTLVKSRVKTILYEYDTSNRGPLDVKWRGVNFSLLLNFVLQFVTPCNGRLHCVVRGLPQQK
jgi:hypothetical protein